MTGFGSGRAEVNGSVIYAEISTVNRKQLEIRFTMPREFASFEHELRKLLQAELSRGQVSVRITATSAAGEAAGINRERVAALIAAARELGREFNVNGELTMAQVMTMPGVFAESSESVPEEVKNAVFSALKNAFRSWKASGKVCCRKLALSKKISKTNCSKNLPTPICRWI